jgi:hypothetical protein
VEAGTDKAPNFVVSVQSSLRVIAIAITAPDVIRTSLEDAEEEAREAEREYGLRPRYDLLIAMAEYQPRGTKVPSHPHKRMVGRGYTERQVRRLVEWYMRVKQAG